MGGLPAVDCRKCLYWRPGKRVAGGSFDKIKPATKAGFKEYHQLSTVRLLTARVMGLERDSVSEYKARLLLAAQNSHVDVFIGQFIAAHFLFHLTAPATRAEYVLHVPGKENIRISRTHIHRLSSTRILLVSLLSTIAS